MCKMIADEKSFMVAGWMVSELGLKGNSLLIYAYIYGCSQDGSGDYHAGIKYLSDLLGIHINSVANILNELTERGLLIKEADTLNGWKLASRYKAVRRG